MIIAIDSTARGPALGGCRWRCYPDSVSARREAQALARAMTRKAAMAQLPLGGGKAVVVGDPSLRDREQLRAFGAFVDTLDGRYITGADMGTGEAAMAVIAESTQHVLGLPREQGGAGDPGPYTALGVHMAIDRALARMQRSLRGARVRVQGVGSVGAALIQALLESGAEVAASDIHDAALTDLPAEVVRVTPEEIFDASCEVIAPCGPGAVIDSKLAAELDCLVVCGAANNPLCDAETARLLHERDILYAPDFIANAGGLIHLGLALGGGDDADSLRHLKIIRENLDAVFERARAEHCDMAVAAERVAVERISSPASSG